MQAKLFMIPWFIEIIICQRVAVPPVSAQSTQALTNDLLVDAHRRHFLEILRRQQQINDALLLNNALLHPHPLPPLHIPTNPAELNLPPAPPLFNPFAAHQIANPGSTSKLGTYGKDDETEKEIDEVAASTGSAVPKEGTVEAPQRSDIVKKTLAGVKTVLIQKKGEVAADAAPVIEPELLTTTAISAEDLEVVQLFKKLNLSKEETKSIVERVEQVVREKLMNKTLKEVETTLAPSTVSTIATSTATISINNQTTAEILTSDTKETILEEEEEEHSTLATSSAPQLHIRNEENLVLQRNNLKHHPIKPQEKKIPESLEAEDNSQGSIKTSLTHLPIFVVNDEEDSASQIQKANMHKRILIASRDREKESDRDLLVDFATGAPLDLTEQELTKPKQEALPVATTPAYSTLAPPQATTRSIAPPRLNYHERTDFERLASDYRRRLEHTGDINKILQKISENAYISLVERGGRRRLFGN